MLQDVPQPPMDTELENTVSGVLVKFTPGFDNYAPISEYKVVGYDAVHNYQV